MQKNPRIQVNSFSVNWKNQLKKSMVQLPHKALINLTNQILILKIYIAQTIILI